MISDYLANMLLDHALRGVAYTPPASVHVALLKSLPVRETATPANEVTGGGYARQQVTFGAAAKQRVLNSAAVTFPNPTEDWADSSAPIVAVALMDASTGGNWLFATAICARRVLKGDPPPKFEIGDIKVSFDQLGC